MHWAYTENFAGAGAQFTCLGQRTLVVGGEWQVWICTEGTDVDGACEVRDPPPLLSRGHFQWCRWQKDLCQGIHFL